MTCWEVLHWPPERVALERACMLAWRERRSRILQTPGPDGSPPSPMVVLDMDTL